MPRHDYPVRPILVMTEIIKDKKCFTLISHNGYTFHHSDKKWRIYRLKDERKYVFYDRNKACKKCGEFNRYYGHWISI
jgi:hypothetical protein